MDRRRFLAAMVSLGAGAGAAACELTPPSPESWEPDISSVEQHVRSILSTNLRVGYDLAKVVRTTLTLELVNLRQTPAALTVADTARANAAALDDLRKIVEERVREPVLVPEGRGAAGAGYDLFFLASLWPDPKGPPDAPRTYLWVWSESQDPPPPEITLAAGERRTLTRAVWTPPHEMKRLRYGIFGYRVGPHGFPIGPTFRERRPDR